MQPTFSDLEYQGRKTRREQFLERMDGLIPWRILEDRIRPFYPKAGRGRHPYPLQPCGSTASNSSTTSATPAWRTCSTSFRGIEAHGPLPDETTILNFRHLLERHNLGQGLLEEINAHLESQGLRLREGSGRHHHRGSVIHQEPGRGAGPGDAPDQKGEPVALRDEGPHWAWIGDGDSAA